ncbi:flagellar basal body L-ring protein FlgH [Crenobacter intestini]|uniref:flagellar basal body L-ring protein FlgH n=1 Tax=Crenobacter intestini TaxID=2563443 RepID=UPI001F1D318F|nr:flagellar basal body L-ring protein FlgH [Crenobacter intestini]
MSRIFLLLPLLLAACASQQPSIVAQPVSARPQPVPQALPATGSIFQNANYRPMFEDRVPVRVGDILTVQIEEKTQASLSEESKGSRNASITGGIDAGINLPFFPGYIENKLGGAAFNGSGEASRNGKGSNTNTSSFNSSITVTVIDALPNGNLMVSGEKQMRINEELQIVRLSGVVNPRDIKAGNFVSSTRVADARLEQVNEGSNRLYNQTGWLGRFFLSILPF